MKVDAQGHDYDHLLDIQKAHLLVWKLRIRAILFDQVEQFILSENREAREGQPKHRVYRGQDLIEILRQWPDLQDCYRPAAPPEPASPAELI